MTHRLRIVSAGLVIAWVLASCAPGATVAPTESTAPSASSSAEMAPAVETAMETATPTPTAMATESTAPSASPSAVTTRAPATASPPSRTPAAATPTPTAATVHPTVTVLNQHCSSGKLIVVAGVNVDSSYRKGVSKVVMARQNEYDVWLDFNATWMGPETGSGNQWTATVTHLAGNTVRITATAANHSTTTLTKTITASC
jgi:hypothetical protein